jgi:uncharacterized iron-regulated membrane protein
MISGRLMVVMMPEPMVAEYVPNSDKLFTGCGIRLVAGPDIRHASAFQLVPGITVKIFFRKLHRWLGLAMALQIIAWMISGLYFAWFPIDTIRGSHLAPEPPPINTEAFRNLPSAEVMTSALERVFPQGYELDSVSLLSRTDGPAWRLAGQANGIPFTRLLDNGSGDIMEMLGADQARQIARQAIVAPAILKTVSLVQEASPGSEYRGRPLPAWRADFSEPEGVHVYLDAWTGEVTARRTARWRVFDFLWMLHIMDFDERDDFNTVLLQVSAFLGLLIALSGVVFWAMTTRLFRRHRQTRG